MVTRILAVCGIVAIGMWAGAAEAQTYTPINVTPSGTQANALVGGIALSGDGKIVGFATPATNLTADYIYGTQNVFVRDLATQTTTIVSVDKNGITAPGASGPDATTAFSSSNIALNQDGSLIAFASQGHLDSTAPYAGESLFLRDRTLGTTTLLSVGMNNAPTNGDSGDPRLSANGRYVLFSSEASNLIADDHNHAADVFLRDRVALTTTRLSVSSSGNELAGRSYGGRLSADAQVVVFLSEASGVVGEADPLPCLDPSRCARPYLLDRGTGKITRIPLPTRYPFTLGVQVRSLDLTPDGRFVAIQAEVTPSSAGQPVVTTALLVYDRQQDRVEVDMLSPGTRFRPVAISPNGRYIGTGGGLGGFPPTTASGLVFDRTLFAPLAAPDLPADNVGLFRFIAFGPTGLTMVLNTYAAQISNDHQVIADLYLVDRDSDHDGMPDTWETAFGLNRADPADAALDPDHDGTTNVQEYERGSHPQGSFKRYFAEGAANGFFSTRFGIFNPGDQSTVVSLEFLGSNSQRRSTLITLPAHGWSAVTMNESTDVQPDNSFSTVIESDHEVVADRLMTWDKSGYGSSAETSIESPSTTWYLAEGSTGGAFDLFYLLQNPGDAAATVTVNYLRPAPAAPIAKTYLIPARTRQTIYVDTEGPELAATDVSAKITSDQPILAERAMYFSTPTQPFAAGHEGAAVAAPATSWFLAEGATGSFFDLFLLLANAETTDAQVTVTYLLTSGDPIVKHYLVAAQSRMTINVDFEDPRLLDASLSTIVESTNNVPVIAERAMWWPSPNWYEAHLSAGSTTTGTRWALADGLVTNTAGAETETYILLANTSPMSGSAAVTLYFPDGSSKTKTYALSANSRFNVQVSVEFPEALNKEGFGTIIQSDGLQLVVERAIYSNANGQTWAAGSDALGAKLQ